MLGLSRNRINNIKQQSQTNQSNQLGEDIEHIRQILKNLIKISKGQEDLMNNIRTTRVSDPLYQEIIKKQYHLKEKMQPISDTLFAISKRQTQIGYLINQELNKIVDYVEKSISTLKTLSTHDSFTSPSSFLTVLFKEYKPYPCEALSSLLVSIFVP